MAGQMPRLRRVEHPGRDGDPGIRAGPARQRNDRRGDVGPLSLPDIPADGYERIPVSIDELSRVLGRRHRARLGRAHQR